jgi:hypothetical protein
LRCARLTTLYHHHSQDFEESEDDSDGEGEDMEDQSFSMGSVGSASLRSGGSALPKSSLRSASAPADSKKRKLAFDTPAVPSKAAAASSKTAAKGAKGKNTSNKARVEVEYELEEEGERVPAQLRILAAQAAQANPSGGGRAPSRGSRVLKR